MTRTVSGQVKFTTAAGDATQTRGGLVYASGTVARGHLVLRQRRRLRPGRYTLTVTRREGNRLLTTRWQVTMVTIT
jgi:hypothetical protein